MDRYNRSSGYHLLKGQISKWLKPNSKSLGEQEISKSMLCLLLTYIDCVMSSIGALPSRTPACSRAELSIIRIVTWGIFLILMCNEQSHTGLSRLWAALLSKQ